MPSIQLSVLALASSVFATRHRNPYAAHKHHHSSASRPVNAVGSAAPYAYPNANETGFWGSTGIATPTAPGDSTAYQTATVDAESGSLCTTITVTHTEKVTATITAGQNMPFSSDVSLVASSSAASAAGYAVPSSRSSFEASPVESSASSALAYDNSSAAPKAPAYSKPASSSTEASPVTTAAPGYSDAAPSATLSLSAYGANKQVKKSASVMAVHPSASSTHSAVTASYSGSPRSAGKRGLAYNDASLTSCFSGSREISWAYNWASNSGGLTGNYSFVPTLWGPGPDFVGSWSKNAQSAIRSGSRYLFSFNEPDHTAQANMGHADAAAAYAKYMNPFKGQAQLCAPSVTNGGGAMGLSWLKNFLHACTDCQIDCLNIHWYDSADNTQYFKSHIEEAAALAPGKPIFISEFGATGSDAQINSFLQEVMPWMDSKSEIAGYAYFMVESGKLVSGTEPSTYGSTYMSYTS